MIDSDDLCFHCKWRPAITPDGPCESCQDDFEDALAERLDAMLEEGDPLKPNELLAIDYEGNLIRVDVDALVEEE